MKSEQMILGQIILDNNIFFHIALKDDDFLDLKNKRIFMAIKKVFDSGNEANLITIMDSDKSIDPSYLSGLTSNTFSSGNYKYYVDKIKEKSTKYHLSLIPNKINDMIKATTYSSSEILEEIEKQLVTITSRQEKDRIKGLKEVVPEYIEHLEQRYKSDDKLLGISTGFPTLDSMMSGLKPSKLILLSARPNQGKTAFMLNMASHIAFNENKKVGILSLESPTKDLINRIVAARSKIDISTLNSGLFTQTQFARISDMVGQIWEKKIFFYDVPNLPLTEVKSQARRMKSMYGIDVLMIDYIGLIQGGKGSKKHERIEEISMAIKELARRLEIPIVALAQINRDAEKCERPTAGHLADSDQLVKDADTIILLHNEYNEEKEIKNSYAIVDKERDGKKGVVPLHFEGKYTLFTEQARG